MNISYEILKMPDYNIIDIEICNEKNCTFSILFFDSEDEYNCTINEKASCIATIKYKNELILHQGLISVPDEMFVFSRKLPIGQVVHPGDKINISYKIENYILPWHPYLEISDFEEKIYDFRDIRLFKMDYIAVDNINSSGIKIIDSNHISFKGIPESIIRTFSLVL